MAQRNSEVLLEALRNPTKLGILVLLSGGDTMTVTQMSKLMKVSRANLYHFVSEMVADGVLAGPENRVKRNYVEKYYWVDRKLFVRSGDAEFQRQAKQETPEAYRDILYSFLASMSAQFRIIAEQLAVADAGVLKKLVGMRDQKKVLGAFMVLHDDEYMSLVRDLNRLLARFERRRALKASDEGWNRVALLAIPASLFGQANAR